MGLSINSNIPALQAGRQTRQANGLLSRTLQQLATARRINRAADDAAGLAIAEGFNTRARQGQVEINNLQSGVSLAQTADSGLSVQQDALQRLRDISLQASNGTLSESDRAALNAEAQQLQQQINSVAGDTQFNGTQVLNQDQTVDLGTEGGNQVQLQSSTAADLGVNTVDLTTPGGAQAATAAIDQALAGVADRRSNLGAQINRLGSAINQRETSVLAARESASQIRDADVARAVTERNRAQLLLQAGIGSIAQANVTPQTALNLLGS